MATKKILDAVRGGLQKFGRAPSTSTYGTRYLDMDWSQFNPISGKRLQNTHKKMPLTAEDHEHVLDPEDYEAVRSNPQAYVFDPNLEVRGAAQTALGYGSPYEKFQQINRRGEIRRGIVGPDNKDLPWSVGDVSVADPEVSSGLERVSRRSAADQGRRNPTKHTRTGDAVMFHGTPANTRYGVLPKSVAADFKRLYRYPVLRDVDLRDYKKGDYVPLNPEDMNDFKSTARGRWYGYYDQDPYRVGDYSSTVFMDQAKAKRNRDVSAALKAEAKQVYDAQADRAAALRASIEQQQAELDAIKADRLRKYMEAEKDAMERLPYPEVPRRPSWLSLE